MRLFSPLNAGGFITHQIPHSFLLRGPPTKIRGREAKLLYRYLFAFPPFPIGTQEESSTGHIHSYRSLRLKHGPKSTYPKTKSVEPNPRLPHLCRSALYKSPVMLGVVRRSVTTGSRRFDRQRIIEGHLLRSARSNANLLEGTSTRTYSYTGSNGACTVAIQRIIEGAAGSASSREDRDWKKEAPKRSLHLGQPSLDRNFRFDKFATIFHDPLLAGIRMPRPALSLDVLRPSAELMKSSLSSPFSPRTSLRDPLQTALGIGWQGPQSNVISHRPAKRYFSSEPGSPNSQYKTSAKIPTPKSAPNNSMFSFASFDPQALLKGLLTTTWSITKTVLTFLVKFPMNVIFYLTHPKDRREKIQEIKGHAKKEFDHYWTGSKVRRTNWRPFFYICRSHSLIGSFPSFFCFVASHG
jgi:hypothetical protein